MLMFLDEALEDKEISLDKPNAANSPDLSVAHFGHRYHKIIVVGGGCVSYHLLLLLIVVVMDVMSTMMVVMVIHLIIGTIL